MGWRLVQDVECGCYVMIEGPHIQMCLYFCSSNLLFICNEQKQLISTLLRTGNSAALP